MDSKKINLAYISIMEVPTKGASLVNIVKMCKAFQEKSFVKLSVYMPTKSEKKAFDNIKEFGFEFENLKFLTLRFGRIFYILRAVWLARSKGEIVYTRSVEVAVIAQLFGVSCFLELHSPHRERNILVRKSLDVISKSDKVKVIISISDALRSLLTQNYSIERNKILVAHDGADLDSNEIPGINFKVKNIGYIGHLYKGRGLEIILNLAKKFPSIHFHIVGGDSEQVKYWKDTTDASNLIFYGHLTHPEAQKIRNSMDVLLAPYQRNTLTRAGVDSTQWMSPLKIFEYMASGVPFISSDLPVLKEVLCNGRNCILVPPDQEYSWEEAIHKLVSDSELRKSIAKNAFNDIKLEYSWAKRAEIILDAYKRSDA